MTRLRWTLGLVCGIASLIVIFAVPYLPLGTDLYVHVLWPWQVMRCLSAGSLPVWFPDLDAGFGSPGVQLYSPLVPTLCGALGLLFGTAGRALRAVLVLSALVMFVVAPSSSVRRRLATVLLLLAAPAIVVEFLGRFPVAQLASTPLAFVLLHRAADGGWSRHSDAVLLALMWLAHAPTTMMVGILALLAPWVGPHNEIAGNSGFSGCDLAAKFAMTMKTLTTSVLAAGLTAWHWWPLFAGVDRVTFRGALTTGELSPSRNLLGVSGPHLWHINTAMGWSAVGLLTALLVIGAWRCRSGRLALLSVFFASLPSAFIWQFVAPLSWLQFPWRWLLPATLLTVPLITRAEGSRGGGRKWLAMAFLMLPLLGAPHPVFVPDPGLAADMEPQEAGNVVAESFGGNPLLVDVREHRPLWWESLAPTLEALGARRGMLVPEVGMVEVVDWSPLRRVLDVTARRSATLVVRLLADDHWWARVNGELVTPQRWGAALAVPVPQGKSRLEIFWAADWHAILGALIALATLGWMALASLRHKRRAAGVRRP